MKKLILWLGAAAFILWLGVPSIQQAMKTHDGKRCHDNLVYIQNGKNRYIESLIAYDEDGNPVYPDNPSRYMDIIPYMPLKNIPECPSAKPYLNTLDLRTPASCQVNGNSQYEPQTPDTPLDRNGFHDLQPQAAHPAWWEVPLRMLRIVQPPKTPFLEQENPEQNPVETGN